MSTAERIILAEDDPIMRELACARLSEAGYCVTAAENGAAALALLRRDGADLVISDLNMPEMDGFTLTETIRADDQICETPIIVITSSDHEAAVDRAFAVGATSFLAKPVNWPLFNHAVRFVLRSANDQKDLRAARDRAEAGEKFKDSVMSVMSHELRTPLNAIIGFGQLISELFEKNSDSLYKEYSDYIVDGGKRLLNSISDMLLASDARSGPIQLNEADVTLGALIDEALLAEKSAITSARAEIKISLQDRDLELCCDGVLMSRALAKLIGNAVKFSPSGAKIIIGAALIRNGDLAILVKDNGPGITPEKLKTATAPFSQSDMSARRSNEGLGLGLLLVQAIAGAHGIAFKLESELGIGTRALLLVPALRIGNNTGKAVKQAA